MKKILLLLLFTFSFTTLHALELDMANLQADIYGQLFIGLSYTHNDRAMLMNNDLVGTGNFDTFDLTLGDFSKVGLELDFYNFSAIIEIQLNYAEIIRRFFLQYEFHNGAVITMGKDWTPVGYSYDQNSNNQQDLWDYGALWDERQPQVRFDMYGMQFAIIYPDIDFALQKINFGTTSVKSAQFIPRFEVAYSFEIDSLSGKIFAGYAHYTARAQYEATDTEVASSEEVSFDTYVIGVGLDYTLGRFTISATGFYGENLELTGQLQYMNGGGIKRASLLPSYNNITNRTTSIQSTGGALRMSVELHKILTLVGGAGYSSSSNTSFKSGSNDDHFSAYVNLPITLSKYFTLSPEVSYFNEMDDINGAYQGNAIYCGAYLLAQF